MPADDKDELQHPSKASEGGEGACARRRARRCRRCERACPLATRDSAALATGLPRSGRACLWREPCAWRREACAVAPHPCCRQPGVARWLHTTAHRACAPMLAHAWPPMNCTHRAMPPRPRWPAGASVQLASVRHGAAAGQGRLWPGVPRHAQPEEPVSQGPEACRGGCWPALVLPCSCAALPPVLVPPCRRAAAAPQQRQPGPLTSPRPRPLAPPCARWH